MSEFHVEVVRIGKVLKHPNADRLEITNVFGEYTEGSFSGGYPVIIGNKEFKEGDLAVYVPVDAVVPETDQWAWLWDNTPNPPPRKRRIKAKKLRGVFSMGLLAPLPENLRAEETENIIGLDVADWMGITKYEDPSEADHGPAPVKRGRQRKLGFFGRVWRAIKGFFGIHQERAVGLPQYGLEPPALKYLPGYYDIEPFRRYAASWFDPNDLLVVTEKIHGQNASFVVDHNGKLHLKSRTRWRENDPTDATNAWAKVAQRYDLANKLALVPGVILYGEAYGNFADCPYGASNDAPGFVAFDAFDSTTGKWLPYQEFEDLCDRLGIPAVPVLAIASLNEVSLEQLAKYAEGKTQIHTAVDMFKPPPGHVREGFVIKPISGRCLPSGQRIVLKLHGEGFLTRKDADRPFDAKPTPAEPLPDPLTTEYGLAT